MSLLLTRAAVASTPGAAFRIEELLVDGPRPDEILVRVVAAGLCHTDLVMRDTMPGDTFPRIFGHEGAGVVEQVGDAVTTVRPGDHVVLSYRACGTCEQCQRLGVSYCSRAAALNYSGQRDDATTTHRSSEGPVRGSFFGQSSFAHLTLAHPDNVVVVDSSLDLTRLGPFGCGFLTGAGAVLNVLQPQPEDSFVVHGAGAVGLAALAAAAGGGVTRLVAVDPNPQRREVAASYGAQTIDPTDVAPRDLVRTLRRATEGGAHHALDTTGISSVISTALSSLRARGTLVVVGLGARAATIDVVDLMTSGKTLRGSVEGDSDPQTMIPRLIELAQEGRFDVDRLLTTYAFDEIEAAAKDHSTGSTIKPILVW